MPNQFIDTIKVNYEKIPMGLFIFVVGKIKSGKTELMSACSALGKKGVLLIEANLGGADWCEQANVMHCGFLNPPVIKDEKSKAWKEVPPFERGYFYRTGPKTGQPMPMLSLSEIVTYILDEWDNMPFDTIAIDTINDVYQMFEDRAFDHFSKRAEKEGKDYSAMGDYPYGSDWAMARTDTIKHFLKTLLKHNSQSKNPKTILVAGQLKEVMDVTGQTQDKVELPSVVQGVANWLNENCDMILQTYINPQKQHYAMVKAFGIKSKATRLTPLVGKKIPFFKPDSGPNIWDSMNRIFKEYNDGLNSEEFDASTEQDKD